MTKCRFFNCPIRFLILLVSPVFWLFLLVLVVLVPVFSGGAVAAESPSALEIIRSRSLWESKADFLETGSLPSFAGSTFTNPENGLGLEAGEEESAGPVDFPFEEFTRQPVTFSETLTVLGAASLAATSVAGPLTQDGTLLISGGRNIDVVGDSLRLQSDGLGPIDFIAGKMKLDREGNLRVEGELEAVGGMKTDFISPLVSGAVTVGQNLVVEGEAQVGNLYSRGTISSQSLTVNGRSQMTGPVDVKGNLAVTDYIRTGDLVIDRGLRILNQEEGGAVGSAMIYAGTRQTDVVNVRVTEKSKIFITLDLNPGETDSYRPSSFFEDPGLFVLEKVPGSHFTVATNKLADEDLTFNWLLIN